MADPTDPAPPPVDGSGSCRRWWVVVKEPRCCPEKKGPFSTSEIARRFVSEIFDCRPGGTEVTLIELTWDFDIWVTSGIDVLTEDAVYLLSRTKAPSQRALCSLLPHRNWQPYGRRGKPNHAFKNLPQPEVVTLDDCGNAKLSPLGERMCKLLRAEAGL